MRAASMILRVPATLDSLVRAQEFVRDCAAHLGTGAGLLDRLDLVVEELVVNIGSYAYPDRQGDMEVGCELRGDPPLFCIMLRDWGVAFDPLERDAPDLESELEERDVGGLGIFLVRELATRCTYHRANEMNEFRACFALENDG